MYPGGIPGPGLIFEAFELVGVRRCRGVRCSTCATTCAPSPFVVSLSVRVARLVGGGCRAVVPGGSLAIAFSPFVVSLSKWLSRFLLAAAS